MPGSKLALKDLAWCTWFISAPWDPPLLLSPTLAPACVHQQVSPTLAEIQARGTVPSSLWSPNSLKKTLSGDGT